MDFNRFATNYSDKVAEAVRLPACGENFFLAAKGTELLKRLRAHFGNVSDLRILDVGCGIGLLERQLAHDVAVIVGVDIAIEAVRQAQQSIPRASFACFDGLQMPFDDCSFDAAVAVCAFHHMDPSHQRAAVMEMARVVRPGGVVVIFEHNPWNPATRLVVSRCELDRDATLLPASAAARLFHYAQLRSLRRRFLFFFPWPGPLWRTIEQSLGWLPLGAQYMMSAIRPAVTARPEREGARLAMLSDPSPAESLGKIKSE